MENTSENKRNTQANRPGKQICIGILAHVDAGKTTLSEALLYLCGNIRKPGRVDNQDAFLDTYELEKKRGITIFSKQALTAVEGLPDHAPGYAGTCGFFCGDGTGFESPGLRGTGDQRSGRRARSYQDPLEAAAKI